MSGASPRFADLGTRVVSALVLAAVAALCVRLGGFWFAAFAALAAGAMLWELHRVVTGEASGPAAAVAIAAGVAAVLVTWGWGLPFGAMALLAGIAGVTVTATREARAWLVPGLVYVGVAMCFAPMLRDGLGAAAVVWLALVVAAADVGAYFAGRAIGGPKLWPAVSPGKTRSGAVGGLIAAVVVGVIVALVAGWPIGKVAVLSAVLALASQAGDLAESAVKRAFGVKDASALIPGHGGVLDRLDGIMGAAWAFGLYVLAGGGLG